MLTKTIKFAVLVTTIGLFLAVPGGAHAQYSLTASQSNGIDGLAFSNSILTVEPSTFSLTTVFNAPQPLQVPNPIIPPVNGKVYGPELPPQSTPSASLASVTENLKNEKPESTSSAGETPSPKPTTSDEPESSPTPSPAPKAGLSAEKLWDMVNSYREKLNLPAFQKDDRACTLANSRAPEVDHEVASGTMHSGLKARKLDYWNTENIIDINSEKAAFDWWIHDKIHKDAIESDNKYSCIACSGNACAQEFTNFTPK